MSFRRRIRSILNLNLNALIEEVEDHESLAKGAVKDCARGVAELEAHLVRMKSHLKSVQMERMRKEEELSSLTLSIKSSIKKEEALALSRRGVVLQKNLGLYRERELQITTSVEELESRVLTAQQELHALAHRTHSLQARSAQLTVNQAPISASASHETLERWENRVRTEELYSSAYGVTNPAPGITGDEVEAFLLSIRSEM